MQNHNPRPGESYGTKLLSQTATERKYKVLGEVQGKHIKGELTLKLASGEFDGYDWTGTELTEDETQAILDLFAQ